MKQNMFHVVKVEAISNDKWLVSGRAWEDIHIGDLLIIDCIEPEDKHTISQLKVTGISTYGCDVLELNRMLTGNITLQGIDGSHLKAECMLIRNI